MLAQGQESADMAAASAHPPVPRLHCVCLKQEKSFEKCGAVGDALEIERLKERSESHHLWRLSLFCYVSGPVVGIAAGKRRAGGR